MFRQTSGKLSAFLGMAVAVAAAAQAQPTATLALDVDASVCYRTDDTVTVDVVLSGQSQDVFGVEFHLQYDQSVLDFLATTAHPPFEDLLNSADEAQGHIDFASVSLTKAAPDPYTVATIEFSVIGPTSCVADLLYFRASPPTLLSVFGPPYTFTPTLINLPLVMIADNTPPDINPPPDVVTGVDPGGCAATLDPGLPTAEDNCTEAADIIISWERSDGQPELTDPYDFADSPIAITWHAEDECGNSSSDVTTITVVLLGDVDYDDDVDLADLAHLLGHYGTTSGASYEDGDIDGDGDVDLSDLAALLAVYGTTCA